MSDLKELYDLVIVGAGPAGLSAALYMARAKYRVLVIEKDKVGGQITITSEVVNYPGIETTSGRELTESMKKQADAFGAEYVNAEVLDMELESDIKVIHTTKGDYKTLGVILAVGANPRKLGFKGEKEFQGRGVAYCATCDGEFFTDMEVFVIGGGFAAVEEGIFLTKYAKHVTMIVREEDFTCAKTVAEEVKEKEKISVKFNTEVVEVSGDGMVNFARFKDNDSGEEWTYEAGGEAFGVFVFAGYVPNTKWLSENIEKNEQGYIITDGNQKTNIEGVYAAGDVCIKNLRQVVTAVSDGAIAATSLEKYVSDMHQRLSIPELIVNKPNREKVKKVKADIASDTSTSNGFLSKEIKNQLAGVFAKFENKVLLKAWLDDSPLSGEIKGFLEEIGELTDKISWVSPEGEEDNTRLLPSIEVCYADGRSSGISFHGVPGGHEINSFVIALYNTAGPGQEIEPQIKAKLKEIDKDINIKVMVSLSCTMCPETVMAAQKAASLSEHIEAEMIDLMHYPELKKKYQVMSVPCMVINDEAVYFGKKGIEEVTNIVTSV
jgi:thioredoxin reductase (NADPH)